MDEELLRQINQQLQELIPALQAVGRSDRIITALGKLSVQLDRNAQARKREEENVKKFVKEVDAATKRIEDVNKAQKDLEKETEKLTEQLQDLGDTTKATSNTLEKQNRIRELGEKLRADRREQWRDKEITTAGQLIAEYERGAGVSQILRDRLETVGGTSMGLNVAARLATAGLQGFGKGLLEYTKAIYQGEQGALVTARTFTTFAETLGTAAQGLGGILLLIPGFQLFGAGLVAGGTGLKALAKGAELAAEQSDRLYGSFVELTRAGVTSSDGMLGLTDSAQRLGFGLDQVGIAAFNQLMTQASRDIAMMAGSAAQGRRRFAEFSGEIVRSDLGRQFMMMGFSVEDINTGVAGFVKQQVALGRAQSMSQQQLRDGAAQYLRELDALTRLTGIQKQELEAQMDSNRRNERFRAAIEKVRREQGDEAARSLELNMAVASERFPELSEGLKDIAAGFVTTEAAQRAFLAGMGDVPKAMTRGIGSGFQELSQAAKLTTERMGSLAEVGAFGPVFGSFFESLKAAGMSNEDAARRALEIMKDQEKGGDAAVASQVDLRRSQMNARDSLQNFVKMGVNPVTRALQKMAGVPEAAVGTLPGETPGGAMTGTTGGGGFTGLVGKTLQALGLGPTAGARPTGGAAAGGEATAAAAGFRPENLLNFTGASGSKANFMALESSIRDRVLAAAAEYNQTTGKKLTINSARRDSADQMRLWQESVRAGRPGVGPTGMPIARPGTSSHELGLAVDIQEYRDAAAVAALNRAGLFQKVPRDPVHFSMARGGIARGPDTGYAATLHGTEAVVPLPDGRAIPVKIEVPEITNPFQDAAESVANNTAADVDRLAQQIRQVMEDYMRNTARDPAMITALQELVNLQRSNNTTQERLLQVSVN